jgi:hypothetical protein
MKSPSRAFHLLEIVTVGLPFCAFKLLTGGVLVATPGGRPFGWVLIALGSIDLVLNTIALGMAAAGRESRLPVCTAEWVVSRARPGLGTWRQLGLSVDTLLAFTLVAGMIGLGWLARLSPGALHAWSLCVVLNVLGAGVGRVADSVVKLGET